MTTTHPPQDRQDHLDPLAPQTRASPDGQDGTGSQTRVALLGAGRFGAFILQAAATLRQIVLDAVVDEDPQHAGELAQQHGARVLTLDEALQDESIDAVIIATPPATHTTLTTAALHAGKDVFCEKPLGVSAVEAFALRDLAQQTGKVVVVDHVLRYNPILQAVRAVQDELGLTPTRYLFENDAADESLPREHWFWQQEHSGGIFLEHGVHFFDAAAMFIDTPASSVSATAVSRPNWPAPDLVSATVVHGPALATHTHSFTHAHRCERQLMRIDYGNAEARITGWIPVEARITLFTGDEQVQRLHELVRRPLPSFAGHPLHVHLTVDGEDHGEAACGRGRSFDGSRYAELDLSLGGEGAKQAVYAMSVAAALADLHECRTEPGRNPRSSAATAAAAVLTAECATHAAEQHSHVTIPQGPRQSEGRP